MTGATRGITITRHRDIDRTHRMGDHGLPRDTVARVLRPTVLALLVLGAAEVLVHLFVQRGFRHGLGELLQEATRPGRRQALLFRQTLPARRRRPSRRNAPCRVPCLWLSYQPSSRSACSPAPSRRSSGSAIKASYTLFKTVPTSAGTHQMGVHSAVGGFTRRGHGASTTRLRPVYGPSTGRRRFDHGANAVQPRHGQHFRGAVGTSGTRSVYAACVSGAARGISHGAFRVRGIHDD